jgi:hypothetical protein
MKRIYASLALLGGVIGTTTAQVSTNYVTIPIIEENVELYSTGQAFSLAGIFDEEVPGGDTMSATVVFGLAGGFNMYAGDAAFYAVPSSKLDADGSLWGWVYTAPEDIINEDETLVYPFAVAPLQVSDSIFTLLNIENFEADSSSFAALLVKRANLENGKTYGWYGYIAPNDDLEESDWNDNFQYIPVIWKDGVNGLGDLLRNTKNTPLEIYPNPTVDQVSFEINFTKSNNSTVARVLDVTGRVVSATNLGAASAGATKYSVNVSQLPAGTYSLQVITDHTISVEKFVKK